MVDFQTGDIFLCDSDKFGPRCVKMLMTAPTIWQYLWRAIRHTQEKVRYYHAGMILSPNLLIEQQWKVQIDNADKILTRDVIVYRKKNLTIDQQECLDLVSDSDLNKTYDVLLILGKTLTWLTGIKWFERHIQWKDKEICPTIVAHWYKDAINETFGQKSVSDITTKIIDEYCINSNEWEIVYYNTPKERNDI